jgi:hypothetical protein
LTRGSAFEELSPQAIGSVPSAGVLLRILMRPATGTAAGAHNDLRGVMLSWTWR